MNDLRREVQRDEFGASNECNVIEALKRNRCKSSMNGNTQS